MKDEIIRELRTNILPYWQQQMTDPDGGFYGQRDADNVLHTDAPRGAILNARILWTFSAAYRVLRDESYLLTAQHAYQYFTQYFIDKEYGGVYWSLHADGTPLDTRKQFYAIGFAIYALSEYARATGSEEALHDAIDLYRCIETHAFDPVHNGYIEAANRDFSPIEDMRLSEKDENTAKSQNTHLHIIEPYTNLYRVWKDETLRDRIHNLIEVFKTHIINPETGHLGLFFDEQWHRTSDAYSCGHDIEFSWLLDEACAVIGVKEDALVRQTALAAQEGLLPSGLMEGTWWEQAETIVGYANMYQRFGDREDLLRAERCWEAVKKHYIDTEHGEWYWFADNIPSILRPDGSSTPAHAEDKAGFWKCPYHNSRMCLEIIERGM